MFHFVLIRFSYSMFTSQFFFLCGFQYFNTAIYRTENAHAWNIFIILLIKLFFLRLRFPLIRSTNLWLYMHSCACLMTISSLFPIKLYRYILCFCGKICVHLYQEREKKNGNDRRQSHMEIFIWSWNFLSYW